MDRSKGKAKGRPGIGVEGKLLLPGTTELGSMHDLRNCSSSS